MGAKVLQLISTSAADDLAYCALRDACAITAPHNVRIVGGQMVDLLMHLFPTPGQVLRRTVDADLAIDISMAASGALHAEFEAAGYKATYGNTYIMSGQQIDLLVPSFDGKFSQEILGARAFDAVPGIYLALSAEPILIRANAVLTNNQTLQFEARVPNVEIALVLKALAFQSRLADKDLVDIYNLLQIANSYQPEFQDTWTLSKPSQAARLDAQVSLHKLADRVGSQRKPSVAEVKPEVLVALIRKLIALPS